MAARKLDPETARKRLLSMPEAQRAMVLRECGDWRHTVRHVLINDMPVERYARRFHCHAPAMLDLPLNRLAVVMRYLGAQGAEQ